MGVGGRGSFGFCTSGRVISESCIFDKTSKRLQVDNGGVLFTRCLVQNTEFSFSFASVSAKSLLAINSASNSSIVQCLMLNRSGQSDALCPGALDL